MTNARDKANIPVLNFQSKGIDDNADATAITINSSEQVGIGTTSFDQDAKLTIASSGDGGANPSSISANTIATFRRTGGVSHNAMISILGGSSGYSILNLGDRDDEDVGRIIYEHSNNSMQFHTDQNERMRIDTSGRLLVGKTSTTRTVAGAEIRNDGMIRGTRDTAHSIDAVRTTDDGDVIRLYKDNDIKGVLGTQKWGIGIASPSVPLDVNSSSQTTLLNLNSTAGTSSAITFANTGSNDSIAISSESDDLKLRTDDGNILFAVAENSEKVRITSAGRLGINDSSPDCILNIGTNSGISNGDRMRIEDGTYKLDIGVGATSFIQTIGASHLKINTNSSERLRIDSSGNLLVGKTSTTNSVAGSKLGQGGQIVGTVANDDIMILNRTGNDGNILRFFQDTTEEGNISVSGTTVSYNGFTGTHWSRFTDNSTPNILRGTVLESLDEMCDWYNLEFDVTTTTQDEDGNDVTETHIEKVPHVLLDSQSNGDIITYNHEGTDVEATIVKEGDVKHVKSKISDTVDAKNVYGVFVAYDEDGEGYNDFYVASVGSFVVRIKANETIAKGDLLQSNGDGTAKVQTDDAVRSSSFAKVLSTTIIETYEDGSYLVPCSLMC